MIHLAFSNDYSSPEGLAAYPGDGTQRWPAVHAADQPASSHMTRETFGWTPTHPRLLDDLENIVP